MSSPTADGTCVHHAVGMRSTIAAVGSGACVAGEAGSVQDTRTAPRIGSITTQALSPSLASTHQSWACRNVFANRDGASVTRKVVLPISSWRTARHTSLLTVVTAPSVSSDALSARTRTRFPVARAMRSIVLDAT